MFICAHTHAHTQRNMRRLSLIPEKIKHSCYLQTKVRWHSFICIEHEKPSALSCWVCGILNITVMCEMWGTPHSSTNSIQSYICFFCFLFFVKFNHKSCQRYPYDPCNHYLKFTILFSNSHKWRLAFQCKHCDLVKWNNKTEQWHFVLFKVHYKCVVQGSAISARSAMTGSITSESNDLQQDLLHCPEPCGTCHCS